MAWIDFRGCCQNVLRSLGGVGGVGELGAMLRSLARRDERVVTFVAALEMARQQWLELRQSEHLGPIEVEQLVPDDRIDLDLLGGWIEPEGAEAEGA